MKALVYDKELKLVTDYQKPTLKPNEVLIKTKMVGICNTDYEITKGKMDDVFLAVTTNRGINGEN